MSGSSHCRSFQIDSTLPHSKNLLFQLEAVFVFRSAKDLCCGICWMFSFSLGMFPSILSSLTSDFLLTLPSSPLHAKLFAALLSVPTLTTSDIPAYHDSWPSSSVLCPCRNAHHGIVLSFCAMRCHCSLKCTPSFDAMMPNSPHTPRSRSSVVCNSS